MKVLGKYSKCRQEPYSFYVLETVRQTLNNLNDLSKDLSWVKYFAHIWLVCLPGDSPSLFWTIRPTCPFMNRKGEYSIELTNEIFLVNVRIPGQCSCSSTTQTEWCGLDESVASEFMDASSKLCMTRADQKPPCARYDCKVGLLEPQNPGSKHASTDTIRLPVRRQPRVRHFNQYHGPRFWFKEESIYRADDWTLWKNLIIIII